MIAAMKVAIVGGGPAGLIAAETLAKAGFSVTVYDRKPSVARKFLMAGRGGLNLTHSEPLHIFLTRYNEAERFLSPLIGNFTPDDLRGWCAGLGQETFVGSSGRVFPKAMKASPLLRAWLSRLGDLGVEFKLQRTWRGWTEDAALAFETPNGRIETDRPDATLLALGGASWPSLGSDGSWAYLLGASGVDIAPLQPSNSGFESPWSPYMRKHAGTPLKNIALTLGKHSVQGELMITERGMEGGAVYALSARIRDEILHAGKAVVRIDLRPNQTLDDLTQKLSRVRGRQSFSTYIQKLGFNAVQIALMREADMDVGDLFPAELAALIKAVPVTLTSPFAIDRAISSAGGIRLSAIDRDFMLNAIPGVFVAGEMLDWEAPTGGYLLQACFATGIAAAHGIIRRLNAPFGAAESVA